MPKDPKILFHVTDAYNNHTGYFNLTKALRQKLYAISKDLIGLPNGTFVNFKVKVTFVEWNRTFDNIDWAVAGPLVATDEEELDPYKNTPGSWSTFLSIDRRRQVSFEMYEGNEDGVTTLRTADIGTLAALDRVFMKHWRKK